MYKHACLSSQRKTCRIKNYSFQTKNYSFQTVSFYSLKNGFRNCEFQTLMSLRVSLFFASFVNYSFQTSLKNALLWFPKLGVSNSHVVASFKVSCRFKLGVSNSEAHVVQVQTTGTVEIDNWDFQSLGVCDQITVVYHELGV